MINYEYTKHVLEVGCLEGRRPTKHWSAAALYDAAAAEEIKLPIKISNNFFLKKSTRPSFYFSFQNLSQLYHF